ncbi:MAG TPA: hypothetical protein VJ849_09435, partial [Actinomycetes bacterium]|nr:hypothetical protein [Actinomycetes bacterium]
MTEDGLGRAEPFGLGAVRGAARDLVGPSEQSVQVRPGGGRDDAGAADDDLPTGPVDGDAG